MAIAGEIESLRHYAETALVKMSTVAPPSPDSDLQDALSQLRGQAAVENRNKKRRQSGPNVFKIPLIPRLNPSKRPSKKRLLLVVDCIQL
jgi:hypothetical protein